MATTTFLILLFVVAVVWYAGVWLLGFTVWHAASYLAGWDNLHSGDDDQ